MNIVAVCECPTDFIYFFIISKSPYTDSAFCILVCTATYVLKVNTLSSGHLPTKAVKMKLP